MFLLSSTLFISFSKTTDSGCAIFAANYVRYSPICSISIVINWSVCASSISILMSVSSTLYTHRNWWEKGAIYSTYLRIPIDFTSCLSGGQATIAHLKQLWTLVAMSTANIRSSIAVSTFMSFVMQPVHRLWRKENSSPILFANFAVFSVIDKYCDSKIRL